MIKHRSRRLNSSLSNRIASDLNDAERILRAVESGKSSRRRERKHPAVPARDLLEFRLLGIWEAALNVTDIGVTDNFFDLGGTSMTAVAVMSRVEEFLGLSLGVETLIDRPTVEQLALLIRERGETSHRSSLVAFRTEGSNPPFFCVHPATGSVLCYAKLSEHLGREQPFYGLQSQGRDGEAEQRVAPSVEAMADYYLKLIRDVQPRGPYFVGGWSMGGLIAYELARLIHGRGEGVGLVALMDTELPPAAGDAPTDFADEDHSDFLLKWFKGYIPLSAEHLRRLSPDEQLLHVLTLAKRAGIYPPDFGLAQARRLLNVYKLNTHAYGRYAPQPYAGRVTLFRVARRDEGSAPDLAAAWGGLATGGVEVYDMPGDHYNLIFEPQVQVLAARLADCIRAGMNAA